MSCAVEAAAAAYREVAVIEADLRDEVAKRDQIRQELDSARANRAALQESEDRDAAIRLIDGDDAAPPKPKRVSRIANLTRDIPALAAALPLQNERIAARQAELQRARRGLVGPSLELISDIQNPAADAMRNRFADLAEYAARLLAADIVRQGTIGDEFPLAEGQVPPFSGRKMIEKIIENIPPRLMPAELRKERIFAEAREIAADILNQIKES